MTKHILLSVQDLQKNADCIIFDCRFVLDDTDAGFGDYLESHIPGAVYAHLDNDLSGPLGSGGGRHPLPAADQFAAFLARSGWQPGKLLVAYDDAGGAIAARLWWLMKYFGYDHAALLDGGIPAWWAAGLALESGQKKISGQSVARLKGDDLLVLTTTEVVEGLHRKEIVLADARAAERFRGEIEPIDKVAGHIPGSVSYPYNLNLNKVGTFKSVADLHSDLSTLIGDHGSENLVHMCGSGVTACNNLFAAELAGLTGSKLYVGSWSEWIQDPSRPVGVIS